MNINNNKEKINNQKTKILFIILKSLNFKRGLIIHNF